MNKLFKLPLTKTNALLILSISLVLLLINSCKKELLDSQNKNSITWAKEYYNTTLAITKPNAVSGDANSQPGATTTQSIRTPLWELSSNGENEDFTFVEVPLNYNHRIASVIKIPGENLTSAEKIEIANASFDVLMIYKNKQGIISQQVVTLIPDKSYLKKHNGDMSGNTLAKLDSDFSGFLRYRDWNGGKMFLERIENGLLVKTSGLGEKIIKRAVKITRSAQGKIMNPPMGGGGGDCETTEYSDFLIECWQIFSQLTCEAIYLGDHPETTCVNGGGGIITEPAPEKVIIDSLKPCMKTVLDSIKKLSNGSISGIIQKFSGNTPGYNWVLKDGTLPIGTNGATSPIYNSSTGTVTTIFDSSKFTMGSDLTIARTILHESVHAYLIVFFKTNFPNFAGSYPQMIQEWGIYNNWNDTHHAEFVRSFVNDIGVALEEYGKKRGYNLTSQFYQDIAWGGLTQTTDANGNIIETNWFKTSIPNAQDRIRILNNLSAEQYGVDYNGNPQSKKGNNTGC